MGTEEEAQREKRKFLPKASNEVGGARMGENQNVCGEKDKAHGGFRQSESRRMVHERGD